MNIPIMKKVSKKMYTFKSQILDPEYRTKLTTHWYQTEEKLYILIAHILPDTSNMYLRLKGDLFYKILYLLFFA